MDLLEQSNIHPFAVASVFRKFKENLGEMNEEMEILSTHPHTNSRIKKALEHKPKDNFHSEKIDLEWEDIKGSL